MFKSVWIVVSPLWFLCSLISSVEECLTEVVYLLSDIKLLLSRFDFNSTNTLEGTM